MCRCIFMQRNTYFPKIETKNVDRYFSHNAPKILFICFSSSNHTHIGLYSQHLHIVSYLDIL